jgi:WhiB family redox-sensing transcriptional regulator
MGRAACRGLPNRVFFPLDRRYGGARAVCATCPVRPECLAHALALSAKKGMFGGLTPSQRARQRRGVA